MPYINVLWMGAKYGQHAFVTADRINAVVALGCTYAMGGSEMPQAIERAATEASSVSMLDVFVEGDIYGLVTASAALVDRVQQALTERGVVVEPAAPEGPVACPWCDASLDSQDELMDCAMCGRRICSLCAVECIHEGMLCDLCWRTMYLQDEEVGDEDGTALAAGDTAEHAPQA